MIYVIDDDDPSKAFRGFAVSKLKLNILLAEDF